MQRAQFNPSPLPRVTLATALAVLMGTVVVACERDSTDNDKVTTSSPAAGEARDDRRIDQPGQFQTPSAQRDTTQPGTSQPGTTQPGTTQPGTSQPGTGQQPTTPGSVMGQDMMALSGLACPTWIEGTEVDVEDAKDGVALRFTTTQAGQVEELRNRVEKMGRMYEKHSGGQDGSTKWHMRADRGQPGDAGQAPAGQMPAAKAKVEQIDNGALLVLTATDKTQLDPLREHVRYHERRIEGGECWMSGEQAAEEQPGQRPGA